MEKNDNIKTDEKVEEGVTVDIVDVHVFDFGLKDVMDKFMFSNVIRGMGALVSLALATVFGCMFLIASVHLFVGKSSNKSEIVAESRDIDEANESTEEEVIENE